MSWFIQRASSGNELRDSKRAKPLSTKNTACYGHFGREDEGFAWEEIDKVKALRKGA